MSLQSADQLTFFAVGSTAPTTNVGPWFKNGQILYVWDDVSGGYIPLVMDSASLGYTASQLAPDPTKYTFWIKLDSNGNPLGIYYFYSNGWVDIYAQLLSQYATVQQMQQILSAGVSAYPARAGQTNAYQLAITGNSLLVPWDNSLIDPRSCLDLANSRYVAQVTGIYNVSATVQLDNGYPLGTNTGDAAQMEISFRTGVNGNPTGTNNLWDGCSVPTPPERRWYPSLGGLVAMNAGDYLGIWCEASDTVNTGSLTMSNGSFSVNLVNS
jgi:hypothetical protein